MLSNVKILQKAIIQSENGQILALQRSESAPNRPLKWDLPGGNLDETDIQEFKTTSGRGDDGDILIAAIRREIREETGLSAENIQILHIASGFNDIKGTFVVAAVYLVKTVETAIRLSSEHVDYKWLSVEDFLGLDVGGDGGLIYSALERLRSKD